MTIWPSDNCGSSNLIGTISDWEDYQNNGIAPFQAAPVVDLWIRPSGYSPGLAQKGFPRSFLVRAKLRIKSSKLL